MKKVISVNLGGFVFQIDDEAYAKLSSYIRALEQQFQQTEGSEEIIHDIEYRVAEIFQDKLKGGRSSINSSDVQHIIQIMGEPRDLGMVEEMEEPEVKQSQSNAQRESQREYQEEETSYAEEAEDLNSGSGSYDKYSGGKRFYRNADDKVLGGVCSGFAAYVDADPMIVRLAFLLFFFAFGTGLMVYIILWIIVPEAKTSSDRLRMRGERVTVESIEKTIRKEAAELEKRFKEFTKDTDGLSQKAEDLAKKAEEKTKDFFVDRGGFLRRMFRGGTRILAAILITCGLIVLISVLVALAMGSGTVFISAPEFSRLIFSTDTQLKVAALGLIAIILIPILTLTYKSLKLILGMRIKTKALDAVFLVFWILGLGMVVAVGSRIAMEFQREIAFTENHPIEHKAHKTLYVHANIHGQNERIVPAVHIDGIALRNDSVIFENLRLRVVQSEDGTMFLEETRQARGEDREAARANAAGIRYQYELQDSTLTLANWYSIQDKSWRHQELELTLHVPVGEQIQISSQIREILYSVDKSNELSRSELYDNPLLMTEDGLAAIASQQALK
jgi:phage shock protein PspC (stress-responsive transcriptional regulator)